MNELVSSTIEQKPVFAYSTPEAQLLASKQFVNSVRSHTSDTYRLDYLNKAESLLENSRIAPEVAIRVAVSCFDYCLSDEIRIYFGELPLFTDQASVYFRSDVYKQTVPEAIREALSEKSDYMLSDIVIGSKEHVLSYDQGQGLKGMITPDFAYWINNDEVTLNKPEPPCGVARQEIYRSLLRCGINPLPVNSEQVVTSSNNRKETFYQRKYRRKSITTLEASDVDLAVWKTRTAEHWGRLLSRDKDGSAVLFSSGTSANEAVMHALSQTDSGAVYIHPNWYYENNPTANKIFDNKTQNLADANTLLVNLEPTNYFRLDGVSEDSTDAITSFVLKAQANKDKKMYLVVDSTVDPLFALADLGYENVPQNLVLIKTVSVTKHQEGGRNYFFGAVYSSDQELSSDISKYKNGLGGNLYESHILHFPRPTESSLRKRREIVKNLNESISEIQTKENGWSITPHTYHGFIFPPSNLIKDIVELGKTISKEELEVRLKIVNDCLFNTIRELVEETDSTEIEMGDSFGLPQTRVSIQGGFNTIDGITFRLKLPRICIGYESKVEVVISFVKRLTEQLNKLNFL